MVETLGKRGRAKLFDVKDGLLFELDNVLKNIQPIALHSPKFLNASNVSGF